jgi:hypothetical protein
MSTTSKEHSADFDLVIDESNLSTIQELINAALSLELPGKFRLVVDLSKASALSVMLAWPNLQNVMSNQSKELSEKTSSLLVSGPRELYEVAGRLKERLSESGYVQPVEIKIV